MSSKRFFFVMIGVFLISIAVGVAGFIWTNNLLKEKAKTVSLAMAERDVLQYKIDLLRKSTSSLKDVDKLTTLVDAVLPKEKKQEDLIGDIIYTASSEAGISNNKISNITFTTTQTPDNLSGTTALKTVQGVFSYPFSIQIGKIPYSSLLNFLGEIEKNKRIIQVENISITPNKTDASQIDSVSLSLKTFVRP